MSAPRKEGGDRCMVKKLVMLVAWRYPKQEVERLDKRNDGARIL